MTVRFSRLAALAAAFTLLGAVRAAAQVSIKPYVWATGLGLDASMDGRQVLDENIGFTDLVQDLDLAAQLRVEARRGAWGAMIDLFHVRLSQAGTEVQLPDGAPAALDSKIRMTLLDAAGSYDPGGNGRGFALLSGVRILGQHAEVDAEVLGAPPGTAAPHTEAGETLVDALIGGVYRGRLSRHWSLEMRGDASTGGTKLTWSAGGDLGYTFGSRGRYTITAGYRHLVVEFEEDSPTHVTMTMSGLVTGFSISL